MTKYPGYRTMTAAQRYNARYDRIWDDAKQRSPEIFGLPPRHVDEKTVAERKWRAPLKPTTAQLPADVGLFGDDRLQLDLVEMLPNEQNSGAGIAGPAPIIARLHPAASEATGELRR